MDLPFTLETDLEKKIAADPAWQEGVVWGKPRTGHLEGAVMYHIADLLKNIDRQQPSEEERRDLRLIALVHDTMKYRVDYERPRVGPNHHAYLARRFAEQYIHDPALLDIIELHDSAYHCWRIGAYRGKWERAEEHLEQLLQRLLLQSPETDRRKREDLLPHPTPPEASNTPETMPNTSSDFVREYSSVTLYARFFYADSQTESKSQAPVIWFEEYMQSHGWDVPPSIRFSLPSEEQ